MVTHPAGGIQQIPGREDDPDLPYTAEIISVGTELLLGEIVDTNAAFLSRCFADLGVDVYHRSTVGDNRVRLGAALRQALGRSDIVTLSGGLGPTEDDLTREVVAEVTGRPIVLHPRAMEYIEAYFQRTGRTMSANNRRQALFPDGAEALLNGVGTAPGVWLEHEGKLIICLPGPPVELEPMMRESVIPRLRERIKQVDRSVLHTRVLRFVGIPESVLAEMLADLIASQTDPTLAIYAGQGEVRLRLATRAESAEEAEARFRPIEEDVAARAGEHLYGRDDDSLPGVLGRLLLERGATLATAESCTGGLIAHQITEIPGCSRWFRGGVVAYHNDVKAGVVNVPDHLLEEHGAVSRPVAEALAQGVRERLQATFGIGVTGIAGPDGGSDEKPVGTVYIAWAGPGRLDVERFCFRVGRTVFKQRTAKTALDGLRRRLLQGWGQGE